MLTTACKRLYDICVELLKRFSNSNNHNSSSFYFFIQLLKRFSNY